MITKFNKFNLITEAPGGMFYKGQKYGVDNGFGDMPFYCVVNSNHTQIKKLIIGNTGEMHGDLPYTVERSYPGRLWLKPKLLTFWAYPNVKLFKSIINEMEKELETKIFNNGWQLEVIKTDGEIDKMEFDESRPANDYYLGDADDDVELYFIPLDDYSGSEDVPERLKELHLMDWKEKELAKKAGKLDTNFGSAKTGWDQPHNIKYRQTIYQEKKN